jgi:hypothetical protein
MEANLRIMEFGETTKVPEIYGHFVRSVVPDEIVRSVDKTGAGCLSWHGTAFCSLLRQP